MIPPKTKRFKSGERQQQQRRPMGLQDFVRVRESEPMDSTRSIAGGESIAASRRSVASRRSLMSHATKRSTYSTHIVCAISENLARETCVASLDASAPTTLQVTKQGNGQTYAETIAYLELLGPHEVLLNEGRRNSQLARKIQELFWYDNADDDNKTNKHDKNKNSNSRNGAAPVNSAVVVNFISRACFDQTKGAVLLERVAREETYDASILDEYILLSAAQAVLHYTEQHLGATFSKKCLHLMVNSGGTNKMVIDRSTLLQLELLTNAKSGKTKSSLFDTINYTHTSVGNRLLRINLMSPPTRRDTITARLDLVDAFLQDSDFFYLVLEHLRRLPCLDKMLTSVALAPQSRSKMESTGGVVEVTKKAARKGIVGLISIKTTLAMLPAFARALEDRLEELEREQGRQYQHGQSQGKDDVSTLKSNLLIGLGGGSRSEAPDLQHNHLLRAIVIIMKSSALTEIYDAIAATIRGSTTSENRNKQHEKNQEECFALNSPDNSLMDVVRKAYLVNVDEVYIHADEYSSKHGFHVAVRHSSARGYFYSVPDGTSLPAEFIQPTRSGRCITFTTIELMSLNNRINDNVQDLLIMTDCKIQEVLDLARSKYDALAALSDAIALLDMCHSFADCVVQKSSRPWSRPTLTSVEDDNDPEKNSLVIQQGRYVVEVPNSLTSGGDGSNNFVANNTYISHEKNFTVITGINGSGKSTYLKQIAIITILAHCGSYVPAEDAYITIRDRLCTRIGNTDDQENNISTFMLEMKETAFICRNATSRSLILIDELGRATSNEDGVALAWAVSEKLLKSNALTFFVTHYSQVTRLSDVYPSVQNCHLGASIGNGEDGEIFYTHTVDSGPCAVAASYGVDLAYACGWPGDVLDEARQFEMHLRQGTREKQIVSDDNMHVLSAACSEEAGLLLRRLADLLDPEGRNDFASARKELEAIRQTFKTRATDDRKSGEIRTAYGDDPGTTSTEQWQAEKSVQTQEINSSQQAGQHTKNNESNSNTNVKDEDDDDASHDASHVPSENSTSSSSAGSSSSSSSESESSISS